MNMPDTPSMIATIEAPMVELEDIPATFSYRTPEDSKKDRGNRTIPAVFLVPNLVVEISGSQTHAVRSIPKTELTVTIDESAHCSFCSSLRETNTDFEIGIEVTGKKFEYFSIPSKDGKATTDKHGIANKVLLKRSTPPVYRNPLNSGIAFIIGNARFGV